MKPRQVRGETPKVRDETAKPLSGKYGEKYTETDDLDKEKPARFPYNSSHKGDLVYIVCTKYPCGKDAFTMNKMKKWLAIPLAALIALLCLSACTDTSSTTSEKPSEEPSTESVDEPIKPEKSYLTEGDYKYMLIDDDTHVRILEYQAVSTTVEFPSTIAGKPVTEINDVPSVKDGESVFGSMAMVVRSVVIPEGVTAINPFTFAGCSALTEISIPDTVTVIGDCAFQSCTALSEIDIPASVTRIDSEVFWNCASLTSITIPDGVTRINDATFSLCTALTEITIPDSVTSIGYGAFQECAALTEITLSKGITMIEDAAFKDCLNLQTVHYAGSEADRQNISIRNNNGMLQNANWVA